MAYRRGHGSLDLEAALPWGYRLARLALSDLKWWIGALHEQWLGPEWLQFCCCQSSSSVLNSTKDDSHLLQQFFDLWIYHLFNMFIIVPRLLRTRMLHQLESILIKCKIFLTASHVCNLSWKVDPLVGLRFGC